MKRCLATQVSSLLLLYLTTLIPAFLFFFFNDTATTEIYTLSLHDALPISLRKISGRVEPLSRVPEGGCECDPILRAALSADRKSTTSELQSQSNLVCRLLLEKKKTSYHRPLAFAPAVPEERSLLHDALTHQ